MVSEEWKESAKKKLNTEDAEGTEDTEGVFNLTAFLSAAAEHT